MDLYSAKLWAASPKFLGACADLYSNRPGWGDRFTAFCDFAEKYGWVAQEDQARRVCLIPQRDKRKRPLFIYIMPGQARAFSDAAILVRCGTHSIEVVGAGTHAMGGPSPITDLRAEA